MKFVILASLAAVALAAPGYLYEPPAIAFNEGEQSREESKEVIEIVKDIRETDDYGRFSVNVETANGIKFTHRGAPRANGAVATAGAYSYTAPDGTPVYVQYVADENGFQPQSDLLPVAPEFPHPIPQFVLDQIAKAAEEDAHQDGYDSHEEPSRSYGAPAPSRAYGAPQ